MSFSSRACSQWRRGLCAQFCVILVRTKSSLPCSAIDQRAVLAALPVLVAFANAPTTWFLPQRGARADGGLPLNRCAVACSALAIVQVCGCDVGHYVRHHRRAEQDLSHYNRKMRLT